LCFCAAVVAGTAFAAVMPAHANLITFTASGTDSDNEALSASAAFATSAGRLDLTLTNLLSANVIRSAGQALSDITFTLSSTPGTLDVHSTVGQQGNFSDTGGVVTYVSGAPVRFFGEGPPPPDGPPPRDGPPLGRWAAAVASTSSIAVHERRIEEPHSLSSIRSFV
jgi:hypothetical protein